MDWIDWIGKIVFVKLEDGTIFTYSKVLSFDAPFITIKDRDLKLVTINISEIERIKEENND
jgi:hypothetical protein|tara:strand:+ start:15014 stop:15196 length:183 start_codon:yes stop_codon:yes gene_type:complete